MITIYHANEYADTTSGYTKVATVDVDNIDDAFRLTQNLEGSWSMPETFEDGEINKDYDSRIVLWQELETDEDGNTWGLRSTSSGDIMFDGVDYYLFPRFEPVTKITGSELARSLA